ncbi:MAG: DnaB-like helicase C-terminal domain-containing protein [Peptostreptococcaceae bacterium]
MELKKIVEDIKLYIDADQVQNKILTDRGLVLKNGKCKCFNHTPSADTVMSFDKSKKRFKCFSCHYSCDIITHYQEFYNLSFIEAIKSIVKDFNLNIDVLVKESDRKPKKAPTIHENYSDKVLSYCNKRGISKATIDYVGVKAKDNNVCFEYKNEFGEHIANKYRFTSKSAKVKMMFEKDTNINTMFNMDKIDITKPLLITEGEFDTLASIEAGYKNSVSIPSGVNSTNQWIEANWTWLEQFEEVILWFDNDEAGLKGVREVSNRLSNNIVRVVACSEANDINELLHSKGKLEVLKYINNARIPSVEGIATLDLVEDFNIYEAEKLATGIRGIDDKIVGMMFGSLNVFSGRNGAGKSTILNQIYVSESIRQGYKAFIFSGELVCSNVKEWLISTIANADDYIEYTSKDGHKYKRVSLEARKRIIDHIKDKIYLYDNDDYTIEAILLKMEILVKRFGVKVFCIDNLMTIETNERDEYKAQTLAVKKLKNFAKKYNVIVHLVAHPRKSMNAEINKDDVAGSANITNLADYVTTIERLFNEDGTDNVTKLNILKNRHTGKNCYVELKFDSNRHRFYSSSMMEELGVNYLDSRFSQINIDGEWLPF